MNGTYPLKKKANYSMLLCWRMCVEVVGWQCQAKLWHGQRTWETNQDHCMHCDKWRGATCKCIHWLVHIHTHTCELGIRDKKTISWGISEAIKEENFTIGLKHLQHSSLARNACLHALSTLTKHCLLSFLSCARLCCLGWLGNIHVVGQLWVFSETRQNIQIVES